jgi:cytosine/adenosine deaminase-related metal-dependent hydrolase
MSGSRPLLVRADRAITLDGPVIEDAALLVEGETIAAVGPASEVRPCATDADVVHLPGTTLLPGLINAHCHLDYTGLRGRLPSGGSFIKWALAIMSAKRRLRPRDYEAAVCHGLDELLRRGTTTVFEVSSSYAITRLAAQTPMRIAFFGEVLGINPFAAGRRMRRFRRAYDEAGAANVVARGMAPHAVYSISKRLMKMIQHELARRPMLITVHLLESRDEPRINPWFDARRAVKILDERGLLGGPVLGVHVNYPDDEDVAILAARGAYVAHCPGSHRFFAHDPFPAERLRDAGVPICLGTDSLASNERLDMLVEIRTFLGAHPSFFAEEALRMATMVPARFLGLEGRLGVLRAGAFADIIAVPTPGPCPADEACASVVAHDGELSWVMIGGRVVRRA